MALIAHRLWNMIEVDPLEVAFQRGYITGAIETVERPETAMKGLELAARAAWLVARAEAQDDPGDESPYLG